MKHQTLCLGAKLWEATTQHDSNYGQQQVALKSISQFLPLHFTAHSPFLTKKQGTCANTNTYYYHTHHIPPAGSAPVAEARQRK